MGKDHRRGIHFPWVVSDAHVRVGRFSSETPPLY